MQPEALSAWMEEVTLQNYANPHSAALPIANRISAVRARILSFFNASFLDYTVIFTANSTAALKLLAESINWNPLKFAYLADSSHHSVVGILSLLIILQVLTLFLTCDLGILSFAYR